MNVLFIVSDEYNHISLEKPLDATISKYKDYGKWIKFSLRVKIYSILKSYSVVTLNILFNVVLFFEF